MKPAAILLAALAFAPLVLIGAASAQPAPPPMRGVVYARLGETVRLRSVPVTPLRMLEDSRCPTDVTCVWAGRVRLVVRIGRGTREVMLGQPVPMVGGTMQLASVLPARRRDRTIPPRAYRFGFRFDGPGAIQLIRD